MKNRDVIIIGLSFALALFYTVPWLTLTEQNVKVFNPAIDGMYGRRLLFLFTSVFVSALIFLGYNLIWKKDLRRRAGLFSKLANTFNILIIAALAFLTDAAMHYFFSSEANRSLFMHYLFRNAIIAILAMLVAYALELISRLENVKTAVVTLQKGKLESEIEALKSQMNPHFFFNSMSTLKALIREDSSDAIEFVDRLSATFRYFLEKSKDDAVLLEEELIHVKSYLFVLKKRFGSGLEFDIHLTTSEMKGRILHFSLWTAVENVFKHNSISAERPLHISLCRLGDYVCIRNSVHKRSYATKSGIGLTNLRKRYRLRNAGDLIIEETDSHFEISIPVL